MKKTTYYNPVFVVFALLFNLQLFAQNQATFQPRFNQDVKGDIVLIGNNILNRDQEEGEWIWKNYWYWEPEGIPEAPYGGNTSNADLNMRYINIDADNGNNFNSSSADLVIPNPNCYTIIHAGLYWGAVTKGDTSTQNIRFRGPTGGYHDITGTEIFNSGNTATANSFPYASYADVTDIVQAFGANNQGTYTVGNVSTDQGRTRDYNNGTGLSAGWSLFVVYEDPTLPGKSITSFDGFSTISRADNPNVDIEVKDFRTPPLGIPVNANFAFAALEGDQQITGDRLKINNQSMSAADRSANNFFESSVTNLSATPVNNRNPNSTNTLGFDTGVMEVPDATNLIGNNATNATINLTTKSTSGGNADTYFVYFTALAVDIIEPNILLTKIVVDTNDPLETNIGGQMVSLGQYLTYVIRFQNVGNDNATSTIVRDILPININFDESTGLVLPNGVELLSYDPLTRELIFEIDDNKVIKNGPASEIKINVQVVETCNELSNACSNMINNQAFTTYAGDINPDFIISDDPSFSTNTGCLLTPQATNFLPDINDCTYTESEVLCGDSVTLTAADGYATYSWSTDSEGTNVIGTNQTYVASSAGTYYVFNNAPAPCRSIQQVFTVTNYGDGTLTNPVIPFADKVQQCVNDGKLLPEIYLCGANDSQLIETAIGDATEIIWEKLDESSCAAVTGIECANESDSCAWNEVGIGEDFLANTSGQFRMVINYENGCFNRFYFNVYQNLLSPTATKEDIICGQPGQITVGDVPSGYLYSIDDGANWQTSKVFPVTAAGTYTVSIKQDLANDAIVCIFTVPNVQISDIEFAVSPIIEQPLCYGDKGNIILNIDANGVPPQYVFELSNGATSNLTADNNYSFSNLSAGTYTATVTTEDGFCAYTEDIEIIEPDVLNITAALTAPLTCTDGEITLTTTGGSPNYVYYVNGSSFYQTENTITVSAPLPAGGVYSIRVVDANGCEDTVEITVASTPAPEFDVSPMHILCSDAGDVGTINFNVTNANGNSLQYSIDNGVTFANSSVFTGLAAGDYEAIVQYTLGTDVCTVAPQTITITTATAITATASLTANYTCTTDGEITVSSVSGGASPYMYSINGVTFQAGTTFTGLTDGTYTVTVSDANDCTFVAAPITIDPLDPPTDLTFSNTALSCPALTTDVTITGTTGGITPLEYQIIAPAADATVYQSSNVFSGLAPGAYTFQVMDATGCTYSETYSIAPLPAISVVGQTLNDVTCVGASDGSVEFTVSGTSTFNYTINGGAATAGTSPITLTGLADGTYTIVVTDTTTNCEATATATVNEPLTALSLTADVNPITCNADGSVVINATGGWGGNSYQLTRPDTTVLGPQNSNTFATLTQVGTYTITVTDANGCEVTDTFVLSTPVNPTASIAVTSDFCTDGTNGATLEVTASGGQTPYEYNINGGAFQSNNSFTNLISDSYIIIVRDAYGCDVTLAAETIEPQLTVSTSLVKGLDCSPTPDAEISGTIAGGYAPYTYEINIDGSGYVAIDVTDPAFAITGLNFSYTTSTAGTYQFRITDDQGCTAESGVTTIDAISNPTATAIPVDPTCFNDTDGEIQLSGAGGSGGYTFSFNGSVFTSTSLYTGLDANTTTATTTEYTYQIQDSNGCLSPVYTVNLNNPTEVEASATIPTNTACSATSVVTVTAIGGTGTYTYSFNSGSYSATNTLNVTLTAAAQTIDYSVRDANGCIDSESIIVPAYNPPTAIVITDANAITCNDATTDVTLVATGGVAPFTYEITAPVSATGNTSGATTGIFTALTEGNYTFLITDANGCTVSASHDIAPAVNLAVAGVNVDEVCFGDDNGQAIFTITDVSSPGNFNYVLAPAAGSDTQTGDVVTFTGLTAGTYTLTVDDITTGCTATASVTINAATQISFTPTGTNVNCNETESTVTFTGLTGGTPGYTYAYVATGNPAPAIGTYSNSTTVDTAVLGLNIDVYVKDANDCIVMMPLTIIGDTPPLITAVVSDQCTATSGSFTISATVTAGTGVAPFSYSIDGTNFQADSMFNVAPGTYTVTVRDANNCTNTTAVITVAPAMTANAVLTKDITCTTGDEDASITVTVTGGLAPYEYDVKIGAAAYTGTTTAFAGTSFVYTTTTADTYQFQITDANGCIQETNVITVTPTETVTASTVAVQPTCNGSTDGTVTLTATAGEGPFTYSFNGSAFTTTDTYGGLSAGIPYSYTVRDSKDCEVTGTVTLTEPDPIVPNIVSNPILCNVNTPGSIDVNIASGGVAPFEYTLFDNANTVINTHTEVNPSPNAAHNFGNLTFGDYYITIIDVNGCEFNSGAIRIETPPFLNVTGVIDTNLCSTGVDYTVTTSGGTGPYIYSIFGQPGTATAAIVSNLYTFVGLEHGITYFLQVEDVNGCISIHEAIMPDPPSNIEIINTTATDINCYGANDGVFDFTVQNYDGAVTDINYQVLNALTLVAIAPVQTLTGPAGGPVSGSITGLFPGDYVLQVTESTGTSCSNAVPFRITQPIQALSSTVASNVNANCNTGALVTLSTTGGTGPYTYAEGATGFTPNPGDFGPSNVLDLGNNPLALNWDIVVRDANGCEERIPVVIAIDDVPTINMPAPICYDGTPFTITITGTVDASLSGTEMYSVNGSVFQTSPNFTFNASDTYNLVIRDGNGCTADIAYVVNDQLELTASLSRELTCEVIPEAIISLTANGGDNASYAYEVSTDGGLNYTAMAPMTVAYEAATAGTYFFRVTDAAGCQDITSFVVEPLVPIVATAVGGPSTCWFGPDGSITVNVTSGVGPFTYEIAGFIVPQSSNIITGLTPGNYLVRVTDSKSCSIVITNINVPSPTQVDATASLSAITNCDVETIVTVTGSGGTGTGYLYDFGNGFSPTNTYTVNNNGSVQTVNYTVRDSSGCEGFGSIDVDPLDPPTGFTITSTAITCNLGEDVSEVTLIPIGGVGTLTYDIIQPSFDDTNTTGDASGIYTGLLPGDYTFRVTDANGCSYQELYTIDDVDTIAVAGTKTDEVCVGDANGTATFNVSNVSSVGNFTYTLAPASGTDSVSGDVVAITGLSAGTYTLEVTDLTTGCISSDSVTIVAATAISFTPAATNVDCNNAISTISFTGLTGGTPGYTFAYVANTDPAPALTDYGLGTTVDTSVLGLNINVWVKDANDCTVMMPLTITEDALPTVTVPALVSNQCNLTGDPYTFTVVGTGVAPLSYSIGNGYQSSDTFTVSTPGTYTVTVRDGNGCTATSVGTITIHPALNVTPAITTLPSCADNDGVVTVTGSGGSGNYTYDIGAGPQASNVFSGLSSGAYTVTITDTTTNCSTDVAVTLDTATPVDFTSTPTDVSCNGGSDGTITVNLPASNDNPIYTYEITAGPSVVAAQNSNVFTGLAAGTYTVQVTSGRGCVDTEDVTIDEPNTLTVSGTATDFACAIDNSVNTSILIITEVDGTAPYRYSIDGTNYFTTNTFNIIDNGSVQTIDIYVTDANGCTATNTVIINPLPTITAAAVAEATPIDCNNTGSIEITVTGGSGNFEYQMLPSGLPQASNIFAISAPGDYYFQVNDLVTGCTFATAAYTVAPFNIIDAVATATVAVDCFGSTNGEFEIDVTGYSGAYNYEVFNDLGVSVTTGSGNTATNPQTITGMQAGNFTVNISETASPFCTTTTNVVTIASPAAALTLDVNETSNVTCNDDSGTITAIANGGWGTYEYELTRAATVIVAYSSNGSFTGLSAGTYTVNVRDAGGCIVSDTATLIIPPAITSTITASTTMLSCFGDTNATITANATAGGQGSNYSYTLNMLLPTVTSSGPQASNVFDNLGAGTYQVVITDGYNCEFIQPNIITINEPNQIQSSLVVATTLNCNNAGGELRLSAAGGTGIYEYSDDVTFTSILGSFASSTAITGITPGTYQYYVRDANGCVANVSNEITIESAPALVLNVEDTNPFINCTGENTGVIVATAEGGLGGYTYTLLDASSVAITPSPIQDSPGVFTELTAGTYIVQVESDVCVENETVTIDESLTPLTANYNVTPVNCSGDNDGVIEIIANGGTGIIKYAISPQLDQFFDEPIFGDLAPGTYQAIAQDELGCFVYLLDIVVSEPAPVILSIVPNSILPEVCSGDSDGEFSIELSGGTLPYSVSLDDINGTYITGTALQNQFDFTNLEGGDHVVYIFDAQGCESEWNITFPESILINPTLDVDYGCTNNISTNTVTVTVDDSINPSDLDYSLNGGPYQTNNVFIDVPAGLGHYIDVRHTNGCIKRAYTEANTDTFDITAFQPLTLMLEDGALNEIVAITAGGAGDYEYTFNGESYGSTDRFFIYESGDYTVTVTDRNGCVATATGYFEYIDVCIPNYFTPNGDGNMDEWGPGCTNQYKDLTFDIFDRYGRKIATLRIGEKWDGKYHGKELPTGDYWYVVRLNDEKDNREFVGHFTLYR